MGAVGVERTISPAVVGVTVSWFGGELHKSFSRKVTNLEFTLFKRHSGARVKRTALNTRVYAKSIHAHVFLLVILCVCILKKRYVHLQRDGGKQQAKVFTFQKLHLRLSAGREFRTL